MPIQPFARAELVKTTFHVNNNWSFEFLVPEVDSSSIERLWGSEIVHNVLHVVVVQPPEGRQLVPGDLERLEEVDPLHHLVTGGGGQRSLVSAVWGAPGSSVNRSGGLQEIHQLCNLRVTFRE